MTSKTLMKRLLMPTIVVSVTLLCGNQLTTAQQPQDNFWVERQWLHGFFPTLPSGYLGFGLAVDASNNVYIANGSQVLVYNSTGQVVRSWAVNTVRDVVLLPATNLLLTCSPLASSNQVKVFTIDGTLVRQWGANGSGPTQLSTPYGIAVGTNNEVFVADIGNHRIQVYDLQGNHLRGWGQFGAVGGEFKSPAGVAVDASGVVYVADYNNYRGQSFDSAGTFLNQYQYGSSSWRPYRVLVSPDGLIYFGETYGLRNLRAFASDLRLLFVLHPGLTRYTDGANVMVYGAAFSPDGQRLYVLTDREIRVLRRGYRTTGTLTPAAIPLPRVESVAQRPGTSYVDIDYSIVDPDSATVAVAAVGFVGGRRDLAAMIPMRTFVEGTGIKVGTNIATGVTHRLTWDANADWSTNTANVSISILAKDDRGLVDQHYLTLPTNATYGTELQISRSPLVNDDFLHLWIWLAATGDTNAVYYAGNVYDITTNTVYAQTTGTNTITTAAGRTNLFSRLNVREATSNEVSRAKQGTTPGTVTRWSPRVQVGNLPQALNEFGFDTGLISTNVALHPTNAWWVVPSP